MFFAKVFTQILSSSLAEDWQVRHVFEDLLKLADPNGIVDMTLESIARTINVPIEIVSKGLIELSKPDAKSRSTEASGARIVLLDGHRDWGWRIVNFRKYHESATAEMLRMGERERKQAYRARFREKKGPKKRDQKPSKLDIESELSTDMSGNVRDMSGTHIPSMEEVKLQCAKIGLPERQGEKFWNHWEGFGWRKGGQPIYSWTAMLAKWKGVWEDQGKPLNTNVYERTKPAPTHQRNSTVCPTVGPGAAAIVQRQERAREEERQRKAQERGQATGP